MSPGQQFGKAVQVTRVLDIRTPKAEKVKRTLGAEQIHSVDEKDR